MYTDMDAVYLYTPIQGTHISHMPMVDEKSAICMLGPRPHENMEKGGMHLGSACANTKTLCPRDMTWQVVVLDHGMYRRLREDVRRSYGSLWKAFMTR